MAMKTSKTCKIWQWFDFFSTFAHESRPKKCVILHKSHPKKCVVLRKSRPIFCNNFRKTI